MLQCQILKLVPCFSCQQLSLQESAICVLYIACDMFAITQTLNILGEHLVLCVCVCACMDVYVCVCVCACVYVCVCAQTATTFPLPPERGVLVEEQPIRGIKNIQDTRICRIYCGRQLTQHPPASSTPSTLATA